MRGYQAQQGREISRCLKELRSLRREELACTDEPENVQENEPGSAPAPANDDASLARPAVEPADAIPSRKEPEPLAPDAIWEVDGVPLLDVWGNPRRHPLAAARAGAGGGEAAALGEDRLAG